MTGSPRQVLSLDAGWRFHLGDIDPPLPNTHLAAYMLNKAGYARNGGKPGWDDSDWRVVDLPHDWSVEGEFSPDHHVDAGFLPRGVAWYRRHFTLDEGDRGRYLAITFDGVATYCTVYVNGHLLHRNFCGYTPFTVDVTDVARFGPDDVNTIAVRVDATYAEGWWYEGAGIYRHVWLTKSHPLHVREGSLFVHTEQRADGWLAKVSLTLENTSDVDVHYRLASDLLDPDGNELIASGDVGILVRPRSTDRYSEAFPVRSPRLWSVESPTLYAVRTRLIVEDQCVEERLTPIGFRSIRFDPDHGFFLNEQPLKLKGVCIHQDHAGVGVAVPDSIHEFRVRRLKEMGCNAIRTAHHPPARELLEACDRLGMLVMDENRSFGSSPQHLEQLRAMVRRDRNHPSVILWSICNEEAIQGTPVAANIARAMAHEVEKLDPSRPVMAAVSGGILNDDGLAAAMPLVGINYQLPVNDAFHAKHPRVPVVAAETHCVLSTRGTYATDPAHFVFAADDADTAPWGATARETWRFVSSRPYLAGLFAWTGFDYRGEPTPYAWPCVSAQFGMMDLCGFEKDGFHLHRAFFTRDVAGAQPFVHVLPHWTWPGREGQPIRVLVYTNGDSAELFLDDQSRGRQRVDPVEMAEWIVPYRPGTLRAVAYRRDEVVAVTSVATTGPAVELVLEVHPTFGGTDVPAGTAVPVTVFARDAAGRRVPDADHPVSFTLDGPGILLGVGNGDPSSHEPNKSSSRRLFRGLAQVIVQATASSGPIRLAAQSPGLETGRLVLKPFPVPLPPFVPPARRQHLVSDWRMSPVTAARPDPQQEVLAQDMNSWEKVEPGRPQAQWAHAGGYAIYRASVTPPKAVQARGGRLLFHGVTGAATIFVDGRAAAAKQDAAVASLEVELEASAAPVAVSVLLYAEAPPAGLTGRVEVRPHA